MLNSSHLTISFNVQNAITGTAIPDVPFDLYFNDTRVNWARSGLDGHGLFSDLPPGLYYLAQSSYPDGLTGLSIRYKIRLDSDGSVYLAGERVSEICVLNFPARVKR